MHHLYCRLTARSILLTRRRDYNLTDITVRLLSSKPVTGGERDEGVQRGSQHTKQEAGPRTTGGTRQSKRIRQGRDRRENMRLCISKSTTVKDIKVQVCLLFTHLFIDQSLITFFGGISCMNRSKFRQSVRDCFTRVRNCRITRSQSNPWAS